MCPEPSSIGGSITTEDSMRTHVALLFVALAAVGCKTSGTPPPGGWLVGDSGLMVNIHDDDLIGSYDLASTEQLNAIACRYAGEAWVVGQHATLLYTSDGGKQWVTQAVPTDAHLRTLATRD